MRGNLNKITQCSILGGLTGLAGFQVISRSMNVLISFRLVDWKKQEKRMFISWCLLSRENSVSPILLAISRLAYKHNPTPSKNAYWLCADHVIDGLMYSSIADKVILWKEISRSFKCFQKTQTFGVYDPSSAFVLLPAFEFKYSDFRQKTDRTHIQVMCWRDLKKGAVL